MGFWRPTRNWLRFRSMLYRIIERGPIGRTINETADRAEARDPTEESVLQGLIAETKNVSCRENFDKVIEFESQIDSMVKAFLDAHDIDYVEVLFPLRLATWVKRILHSSRDIYPTGEGDRVISDRIDEHLSRRLMTEVVVP